MKVLHICPDYLNSRLYNNLFNVLESKKIENEIFTLNSTNSIDLGESKHNLKVWEKRFGPLARLAYFGKQKQLINKIRSEYDFGEINIIHAHTLFSAGLAAYRIQKNVGLPFIVAVRDTDVNVFFKYMPHLRRLGNKIMQNAQNIIFLSPAYRDAVLDKYVARENRPMILKKSVVIPNGIEDFFLKNIFTDRRTPNINYIKIIFIGNIDRRKNIRTTIKACKWLIDKGFSVEYTIVGKVLDAKYKKTITKYGFINYHPRCSAEEVLLHLRGSDVFVMPSITETFGLVYGEAMSQGLPVIYSKGQGFDRQFDDGSVGYAVNSFDYKEIAERIIDIYNNYQFFSNQCVSLVDKFNWLKIGSEFQEVYTYE